MHNHFSHPQHKQHTTFVLREQDLPQQQQQGIMPLIEQ
jgi:hypothetical protein